MLKRWWWVLLVMTGIGPILGLLTAAVVTQVMPKKYESRAVIEVRPRMQLIGDVAYDSRDLTGFYRSEASMIESRHSLSREIQETISSKMPNDGLIVLEEPVVPQWPVSPNVPLNTPTRDDSGSGGFALRRV